MTKSIRFLVLLSVAWALAITQFASSARAVANPYWSVTNWWVDDQNSSGVASNSNSCTTITAPCLRWNEILRRLGGVSPPTIAGVVLHVMSSNVGSADPFSWTPVFTNTGFSTVEGVLSQVGTSCTISAVTQRNITSVGTLANITAPCITAANQFIIDATQNARFFTFANLGANKWSITQSLSPCNPQVCPRTEVNTITVGDTITVWTMPTVDIGNSGSQFGSAGGYTSYYHINMWGTFMSVFGTTPFLIEDQMGSGILSAVASQYIEFVNVNNYNGSIYVPDYGGSEPLLAINRRHAWKAGQVALGSDIRGTTFDFSAILNTGAHVQGDMAEVYLQGQPIVEQGNTNMLIGATIWGPGIFDVIPGSVFTLKDVAVGHIVDNGGGNVIILNGSVNACATNPDPAGAQTLNCGIPLTAANIDKSFALGGCGVAGCWAPGCAIAKLR